MGENIIFRQGKIPVFQNKTYPDVDMAINASTGDVVLSQNVETGLVHNCNFNPLLLDYDSNYQNEQACSIAFQSHLSDVLKIIRSQSSPTDFFIEVGCGKGFFLEMLEGAGFPVVGYDPAYEGMKSNIVKKYFNKNEVTKKPDFIILRHVLEHIAEPWEFLKSLSECGKIGTKIFIEVPCFDWIVENQAFYDIFYEHVNYFTLDALSNAFEKVIDAGRFFDGQYLYLIADLSTFHFPTDFSGTIFPALTLEEHINRLLSRVRGKSGNIFIWGAGAKGSTFALYLKNRGISIKAIIDINPVKQNRFAGVTGTPIIAHEHAKNLFDGSDIFVMNPVYQNEIEQMAGDFDINWIKVV